MFCEDCFAWRRIDTRGTDEPDQGFCRLNPPAADLSNGRYNTVRVITSPDDECHMSEFVKAVVDKNKKG